jgi:hypothetical protein
MTQSAEDFIGNDVADSFNGSPVRRIFLQSEVRPAGVVVIGVRAKDVPQLRLAENDHMIEAFSPD